MKRLAAISALLFGLGQLSAIPALAQHGGGHAAGGGHSGGSGFSGGMRSAPSGFTPRSGSAASRPGYAQRGSGPQNRAALAPRYFGGPGMQTSVARGAGSPYRQPYRSPNEAENRRWSHGGVIYENSRGHNFRERQPAYFVPYYWGFPFGLGYYGNDSDYGYDNSFNGNSYTGGDQSYGQGYDQGPGDYYGPDQYNGFDPQGPGPDQTQGQPRYRIQGQYQDQAEVERPEPGRYPNQITPGAPYQPDFGDQYPPPTQGTRPAARPVYQHGKPVPNQPAVTLVFKDNRPNQIIHNYLINGGTLTVWDNSAHDIAVGDLNIEATRKINRDKGIDFLLPNASF